MQPESVRCPRCGWQNKVGDRMCGGCGTPLFYPGSALSTPPDSTPTVAAANAPAPPPPLTPETRTASWVAPAAPQPIAPATATVAAPPFHASPPYAARAMSAPKARRRGCLGRTFTALAIGAFLLAVMAACGWTAIVRPAVHSAFDQRLRAGLAAEVDKVPVIPVGTPSLRRTLLERDFNNQPAVTRDQGDMKDVRIHFSPGEITMTYRLWGSPGRISTQVVAANGRLFARNTEVQGWLAQFENGAEMQDALNASFARLPAEDYVDSVKVGDGTLTVTIRHA